VNNNSNSESSISAVSIIIKNDEGSSFDRIDGQEPCNTDTRFSKSHSLGHSKSHSTGHSLPRETVVEDHDKYTLRLPEDVFRRHFGTLSCITFGVYLDESTKKRDGSTQILEDVSRGDVNGV